MLRPHEFTVGSLADAAPLSLMLPRSKHEAMFLIGRLEDGPAAVFLDGDYRFIAFGCAEATNWKGIIVPNVRIEIDETSLCDPHSVWPPLGLLMRIDTRLVVSTKDDRNIGRQRRMLLEDGLASINELSAGFFKWNIVIGEGVDKRVLREIDATPQAQ